MKIALTVFLYAAVLLTWRAEPEAEQPPVEARCTAGSTPEMSARQIRKALAEAVQRERAVVLLDVDWSATSKIACGSFRRFADDYVARPHGSRMSFYELNLTTITHDYSPLYELRGWKELANANNGLALFSGNGECLISQKGSRCRRGKRVPVREFRQLWQRTQTNPLGPAGKRCSPARSLRATGRTGTPRRSPSRRNRSRGGRP